MHANEYVHLTFSYGTACAADVGTNCQIQHSVWRWKVTFNHTRMHEIFTEYQRVFPTVEYDLIFSIVVEYGCDTVTCGLLYICRWRERILMVIMRRWISHNRATWCFHFFLSYNGFGAQLYRFSYLRLRSFVSTKCLIVLFALPHVRLVHFAIIALLLPWTSGTLFGRDVCCGYVHVSHVTPPTNWIPKPKRNYSTPKLACVTVVAKEWRSR